jgi:hypothetical protein
MKNVTFHIFGRPCVVALPPPSVRNPNAAEKPAPANDTRDERNAIQESGIYERPDAA